jgi:hypothetical protein
MAARRSNGQSGILSVVFTTLFAPIIASVVAGLIKDDMVVSNIDERRPVSQPVVSRYAPANVPAVMLLAPINAKPNEPAQDNFGPSR